MNFYLSLMTFQSPTWSKRYRLPSALRHMVGIFLVKKKKAFKGIPAIKLIKT